MIGWIQLSVMVGAKVNAMRRITLESSYEGDNPLSMLVQPGTTQTPSVAPVSIPPTDSHQTAIATSTPAPKKQLKLDDTLLIVLAIIAAIHLVPSIGNAYDTLVKTIPGTGNRTRTETSRPARRTPQAPVAPTTTSRQERSEPKIGSSRFVFPLANFTFDTATITDVPGSPRDGGKRKHAGYDLAPSKGRAVGHPVLSPFGGVITEVKPHSVVGGILGITSKDGKYLVRLVHINRKEVAQWRIGQEVKAGQRVSSIDWEDSNWGSGPHLHLEIYLRVRAGDFQLALNPKSLWQKAEATN